MTILIKFNTYPYENATLVTPLWSYPRLPYNPRMENDHNDPLISIQTLDGEELKVPRHVLTNASPYLNYLLNHSSHKDPHSPSTTPIPLPIKRSTFEAVLAYIASNQVQLPDPSDIEELLLAGNLFQLVGLKNLVSESLESQISLESVTEIHRRATLYNCYHLLNKTRLFILYNFPRVNSIGTLPFEQFLSIIRDDKLNVPNEDVTFEGVKIWAQANSLLIKDHLTEDEKKQKNLEKLIKSIRFGLLTPKYFKNVAYKFMEENGLPKIVLGLAKLTQMTLEMQSLNFRDPLTRPRAPKSVLFAIGGWNSGGTCSTMETFDNRTNTWHTINPQHPIERAYHGILSLGGLVWLIGGGVVVGNKVEPSDHVFSFNPATYTWCKKSSMTSRRCYLSCCTMSGLIYSLGGMEDEKKERLSSAETYNPFTDRWQGIASMLERRSDASACSLNGRIYIAGGFTGEIILNTVEFYDPKTNQWTMSSPMLSPRCGLALLPLRDDLIALGGYDGKGRLNSAEYFKPNPRGSCLSLSGMLKKQSYWLPMPFMGHQRSNFGATVDEESGMIFVVGGFNGISTINECEYFDPKKNTWEEVSPMGEARNALGACFLSNLQNIRDYCYLQNLPHQQICPFDQN